MLPALPWRRLSLMPTPRVGARMKWPSRWLRRHGLSKTQTPEIQILPTIRQSAISMRSKDRLGVASYLIERRRGGGLQQDERLHLARGCLVRS